MRTKNVAGLFLVVGLFALGGCDSGSPSASSSADGGTNTKAPHCIGTVIPCYERSSVSCENGVGCYDNGYCGGYATCYGHSSYACDTLSGCYWSSYYGDCEGVASSCSTFHSEIGCIDQSGCTWHPQCSGSATDCESIRYAADCDTQPGCTWIIP